MSQRLRREDWPAFIRGYPDLGKKGNLARAEQEGIDYQFKVHLTPGMKKLLERLMRDAAGKEAGQGWQDAESALRLSAWSLHRRVVVLRRGRSSQPGATAAELRRARR